MSKEIIYAGDIEHSKSIIGLLDGSEMFCIENPYFKVDGMRAIDKKSFLAIKQSSSTYGVMLNPVYLMVKTMRNKPFNSRFAIGYISSKGVRKNYYVMKPYETNKLTESVRQKLIVVPSGEPGKEDYNLALLDYQLCMVMEVLLLSVIMDVDLSTYAGLHDNKAFYQRFCREITEKMGKNVDLEGQVLEVDDKYINSFLKIPYYASKEKKHIPITELGKIKSTLTQLFTNYYEIYINTDYHAHVGKWRDVVSANSVSVPSIRVIDYCKKGLTNHEPRFDGRLTFCIQLSPNDKGFNPNFKDFLVTQKALGGGKYQPLTPTTLASLWGGSLSDPNASKGATQSGCLFIVPQLSFKFYNQGNPTVDWRVEKVAVKRIATQLGVNYNDGDEFVGDDEVEENSNDDQYVEDMGPVNPDAC